MATLFIFNVCWLSFVAVDGGTYCGYKPLFCKNLLSALADCFTNLHGVKLSRGILRVVLLFKEHFISKAVKRLLQRKVASFLVCKKMLALLMTFLWLTS